MTHSFQLFSTLSRRTETFRPHTPGQVNLYVCGMTVYDYAHVGHARAMVVFDMVVRYLRHRGWNVSFVRNYTDVDDKIIARASDTGENPLELAERFIEAFREDADALGLVAPDHEPRVTQCMPKIQDMIQALIDTEAAYASDGSVWFSVQAFEQYGKLSGQRPSEMKHSPDAAAGKRDPRDFALWKSSKPGEPAWESPWGPGRPGWHIECSAMVHKHFGTALDIHGGGLDLVFPHHENEIAQSECAYGDHYATYWMHNGLLTRSGGQKMGKSLGNVVNIRDALASFPAEALRMYYLRVHYRSPLPWNDEALPEALTLLARLYDAREAAELLSEHTTNPDPKQLEESIKRLGEPAATVAELASTFSERVYAAMDDDFNTAKAVGYACELARAVNRLAGHKKAKKAGGPVAQKALEALSLIPQALGLLRMDTSAFQEEVKRKRLPALGLTSEDIEKRLAEREAARQEKNWPEADAIRIELESRGIAVMDRPQGVAWRLRLESPDDIAPEPHT